MGEPRDVLSLRDTPVPTPGRGQVLVEVLGAALGFPDALLCRGAYQDRPDLPFVPGAEVCGRVVDAGTVTDVAEGDRVAAVLPGGLGGLAQYAVADALQVYAVPPNLTDAEVAGLSTAYLTAWLGLHRRGALQPGENLVVSAAAGGVGSAAVQIGRAAGACVIAVTRGATKTAVARDLGAHVVVDSLTESVAERIREGTGGRGADVVFDPVGGDTYHELAKALAFGGRILVVGYAGGEIQTARLNRPLLGSYSIVGVNVGLHVRNEPDLVRDAMARIAALGASGVVRPLLGAVSPMGAAARQLQAVADGNTVGRVVVEPWNAEA
ncbi:NADPH:quinone oxidoreductase family protein [Dactylosporangium sucinum]|uniref:NADPH:quinone oxidoreductase family protein n=1 Tax=Dactylosporangium sucinum TaxID=1424081 RepID=UPI001E5DCA7D|nr:NADPH:quinone oxidoreductase family protein [Dactylosporangium sucinum]